MMTILTSVVFMVNAAPAILASPVVTSVVNSMLTFFAN